MKRCLVAVLVLLIGVSALAVGARPKVAAAADPCAGLNPVACDNQKPGFDAPSGDAEQDPTITGFATSMSVNLGETVHFKINTDATSYHIDIYRLGWYGGNGARKMATISPSVSLPQVQPPCMTDNSTGLVDCGNWAESASWAVPSDAVSGVYDATLVRDDTGGMNTIVFVVRNDASHSDILVQTSDATWQAYNTYGGNSLYVGSTSAGGTAPGRAYKVSYNRPLGLGNDNNKFWSEEYPMLLFLERNGYDVSYQSDLDTATRGAAPLEQHKMFLVSGHDEYWSGQQRANVTAARDAGVNLAVFSANTSFWRTRLEPSLDGTANRTLVSYKETDEGAKIDPTNEWTGTYRDPRFSPPAIGGNDPENGLLGTISTVSGTRFDAIQVPAAYSSQRIWRNTSAANLALGTTYSLPGDSLGYEWDSDLDNGSRPAGLIDLSSTTVALGGNYLLTNFGSTASDGTSTHSMTLYKAASGALVFSDGTINWAQFLDPFHDEDPTMEQVTVNILADMGAQPDTLESQLTPASASTDTQPPTAAITSPSSGATVGASGEPVTISGTASDTGGGVVAGVEVSTDGGTTWHPASGTTSWTYAWRPSHLGAASLEVRASDDSANTSSPSGSTPITVVPSCPCHLWSSSAVPQIASVFDTTPAELGTQFKADQDGYITGVRFYKGPTNTGLHTGSLWSSTGQLLATATFTSETAQGWQDVQFSQPVPVVQNQTYVASYHTPNGQFADDPWGFETGGVDSGVLHAPWSSSATPGVFSDAATSSFPTKTFQASNYWVDVDYKVNTDKPTVVAESPAAGSTRVNLASNLTATISKTVSPSSIAFGVKDPDGNAIPGSLSYDAATMNATFTPSTQLPSGEVLTATVSGATDTQGQTMDPVSWSFTTGGINACPCTIWQPTDTPANASAGDTNSVELGLKFRSDHAGVVTGVRFYKGAANTGTHVGSLWSSSGQLLARTTFTGETASGWQQAQFSSPVEIAANTTYVISYHAPNGGYSYDLGYFGNGGVDNSPLHALADGTDGPNAVFVYGANPSFPTNGFLASNYWVDPVFGKDTAAPQVIGTSPTANSTGVLQATHLAVTFDKSIDASGAGFHLVDPQGNVSTGTTSYDDSTHTVAFAPSVSLASGVQYTATVSGVKDLSGNVQAPYTWSFTTGGDKTCPCTIWPSSATPTLASAADGNSVEAGVKFRADEAGTITGVRFYKGATNTGTHTGSLWSSSGQLLATGTFTNETATGWQQLLFDQPVQISAGTTYVASYHAPSGNYAYDPGYFSSAGQDRPPLHALSDGQDGPDSVFAYSPSTSFPSSSDGGANLWVDAVFQPSASADSPPSVSGFTPANGSTGLSVSTAPSVTFSEAVQPGTVSFVLRDGSNNVVAGSAAYNAGTRTVTLTPTAALGSSTTYTATVSGAQDLSGNVMVGQSTWSFTTADVVPPSVSGFTPANGSTGLSVSTAPSVTFSEAVQPATVSFVLRDGSNNVVAGSAAYNAGTRTVTLTPTAALGSSSTYTATVSGAQDLSGNVMVGQSTWSFTTADVTPPVVSGFTPANGSTGLSVSTAPSVTFSEAVQPGTVSFVLRDGSNNVVAGSAAYNAGTRTVTLTPTAALGSSSTYTATVSGAQDLSGNVMVGQSTWSFTTADVVPPSVSGFTPANGSTGLSVSTAPSVTFSEAVQPATVSFVLRDGSNNVVPGSAAYNAGTRTVTLTPTAALGSSSTYTATVSGAQDLSGNVMVGQSTWSFTTADVTPPVVSGFTPANGSTGLSVSTAPSVTFSEAVQPATVSFVLRDGSNNVVPGSAAYNAGTRTVTLTPTAALGSSSTYTATVSGAQDLSGNVMVGQSTWSFRTRIPASVTDSTTANFTAGTVGSGAYVSEASDGEVTLAPALGTEFTGTTLPAGWTSTRVQTTGTTVVSGGSVKLDGTRINPSGNYSRPRSLEFSATFQPSTDETAGLGTNLSVTSPELVFTTTANGHLHAISRRTTGVLTDTDLGTAYLGVPHTFRIDWSNNVVYSIDGTVVATHAQNITGQLHPVAQDATTGGAQLAVSWMHLGPYATTGTFTSRVLDGGQLVTWDSLTAVTSVPAGAGIAISVRSGNTPTPDGTWTAFTPVGAGGAINQVGRYVQYRAALTGGTGGTTPVLSSITLTNFR